MSRLSRRQFVQFAGSALATVGFSQLNIQRQADGYGKVLAQDTPRKLALLVGVNTYSSFPLEGCLNDVELQRHLLIHRFGFNPQDILVLSNAQATRQGILEAFEEHLIKQAKPGDVVVYHYSGHGSRVFDPDPSIVNSQGTGLNSTFVPVDSTLPVGYPHEGGTVDDIMGHTLFLLMSALPTENVTVFLDSCFSGGATRRDRRVRSRDGGENIQISTQEKAYQDQWLSRLDWSREEFIQRYRRGVAKGVVLAATDPSQLALEVNINGFIAGIFTYLVTEYLWQQGGTPETAIAYARDRIPQSWEQTPLADVQVDSAIISQPIYFVNPPTPAANAVVTEVEGDRATLWLGGIDRDGFGVLEVDQVLVGVEGSGRVRFQSRQGLVGEAIVEERVKMGMLLRIAP